MRKRFKTYTIYAYYLNSFFNSFLGTVYIQIVLKANILLICRFVIKKMLSFNQILFKKFTCNVSVFEGVYNNNNNNNNNNNGKCRKLR